MHDVITRLHWQQAAAARKVPETFHQEGPASWRPARSGLPGPVSFGLLPVV